MKATRPAPYVVGTDEIMQRDAVATRARELAQTGKYKTSDDARRAAEKQYPATVNSDDSLQSADYYRWKKQVAVQEKFESDLDKMNRNP